MFMCGVLASRCQSATIAPRVNVTCAGQSHAVFSSFLVATCVCIHIDDLEKEFLSECSVASVKQQMKRFCLLTDTHQRRCFCLPLSEGILVLP